MGLMLPLASRCFTKASSELGVVTSLARLLKGLSKHGWGHTVGSSALLYFSSTHFRPIWKGLRRRTESSVSTESTSKQKESLGSYEALKPSTRRREVITPWTWAMSSFVGTRMRPLRGTESEARSRWTKGTP